MSHHTRSLRRPLLAKQARPAASPTPRHRPATVDADADPVAVLSVAVGPHERSAGIADDGAVTGGARFTAPMVSTGRVTGLGLALTVDTSPEATVAVPVSGNG